ncbi:hypothetical protein [Rhizobium leguminosarum]|uniref:hypothetical protein n=1 Tax=Rhizobium leguminosarum TaxID=384 RepID=UPI001FEF444C|nr:hypothetical protein [Rhizobium leguminosarum]
MNAFFDEDFSLLPAYSLGRIGHERHKRRASEDSGNIVFNQMLKCLKLPADAPSGYNFMVVAVIKDGSADFLSINFRTPPSEWEKRQPR